MKKVKDLPIKEMIFAYLAISKVSYWLNLIAGAEGFEGVWSGVLERLLSRDIIIILLVISIYTFEYMFIMKRKKWSGNLAQVIIVGIGFVMYIVIANTYLLVINWILQDSFNVWSFLERSLRGNLLNLTISYFVIAGVVFLKETFKKKEAYAYPLDIQRKDIKLETLKALLDDGVLSQEDFDVQKVKLLQE